MPAIRRVVTGVDHRGRSVIASDDRMPDEWSAEVWATAAETPLESADVTGMEAPLGGTRWRIVDMPPDSGWKPALAGQTVDGLDAEGFHSTHSVDYVFILDGAVTLRMDDGEVDLERGDCVVQQATRHAWSNRTDGPVRMLAVMLSLP